MQSPSAPGLPRAVGKRAKPYTGTWPQLLVGALLILTLYSTSGSAASATDRVSAADVLVVIIAAIAVIRVQQHGAAALFSRIRPLLLAIYFMIMVFAGYMLITNDRMLPYFIYLFAMLFLLAPLAMLATPKVPPKLNLLTAALCISVVILSASSVLSNVAYEGSNFRDAGMGTFSNPNHTGAFAAAAILILIFAVPGRPVLRWTMVALCLIPMQLTMSYAAVIGLLLGLVIGFWSRAKTPSARVGVVVGVGTFAGLLYMFSSVLQRLSPRLQDEAYLERSRGGRERLWGVALEQFDANPLGIGLGHLATEIGRDIHNEFLTFLGAFGFLGILLIGALFFLLWRLSKGGAARGIVLLMVVEAATHNSLSWRYLWTLLAIAVVYEWSAADHAKPGEDQPATGEPQATTKSPSPVQPGSGKGTSLPTGSPSNLAIK